MPTDDRGPWYVGESETDPGEVGFDGTVWEANAAALPEPRCVAEHVPDRETAEMIVRAVNAHDRLRAAAELAMKFVVERGDPFSGHDQEVVAALRAALATPQPDGRPGP